MSNQQHTEVDMEEASQAKGEQSDVQESPEVVDDHVEDVDDAISTLGSLQDALDEATQQASDNWDKFMRSQAEMDNLLKRSKRDLENAHKFSLEKFVNELLPVRDSLEMGLDHAEGEDIDPAKLKEGSELTLRVLSQAMEKFNVQQIDPQGEMFDPNLHEAMTMVPSNDVDPNHVLTVVQRGYLLNERLIRPARVVVAKAMDE